MKAPDDAAVIGSEGQRVADDDPQDTDHADGHVGLGHRGDDVLLAYQAPVEERETRHHEKDQAAGDEHPSGVAGVDHRDTLGVPVVTSTASAVTVLVMMGTR